MMPKRRRAQGKPTKLAFPGMTQEEAKRLAGLDDDDDEPHEIVKPLLRELAEKHGYRRLLNELAHEFDALGLEYRYDGPRAMMLGVADVLRGLAKALEGKTE